MAGGDGFLTRWSRRKAGAKSGTPVAEAPALPPPPASDAPSPRLPAVAEASSPVPTTAPAGAEPAPLPTLDDVAKLSRDSDFSPYVARNVDAGVRNAAMKKLFSDPHFNVMDGLDTYIADYGKPDPIPLSMLRLMNQSAVLGLFDDAVDAAAPKAPPPSLPAQASPDGAGPATVAESTSPPAPTSAPDSPAGSPADDDPDLQLQRDDADRRPGAGPGPRR
jgi:Protein of unknown function (DUF3306)